MDQTEFVMKIRSPIDSNTIDHQKKSGVDIEQRAYIVKPLLYPPYARATHHTCDQIRLAQRYRGFIKARQQALGAS